MQKYVYSVCFLAGAPFIAHSVTSECVGDRVFSEQEDVVVLQDRSKISGSLTHIPPITFQFGRVPLKIDEIASIAFSYEGSTRKMEITTQEGFRYFSNVPKENFVILRHVPDQKNAKYTIQKEINPTTVNYIVLKSRHYTPTQLNGQVHEIELTNGDRFPVVLGRKPINLSTGLQEGAIVPGDIVELTVDNGIYGTTRSRIGNEEDFDYAFSKDKLLNVQLVKSHDILGLTWDKIAKITKVDPTNNQFALAVPADQEESVEIAYHEVERVKKIDEGRLTALKEENQQLIGEMEELKLENLRLVLLAQEVGKEVAIASLEREVGTPINPKNEVNFLSSELREKEAVIQQLESQATTEISTVKEKLQKECDRSTELEYFLKDAINDAKSYQQQICSLSDELQAKGKNFERLSELEGEVGKLRNQYLVAMESTESYENMIRELQERLEIEKSRTQGVDEMLSLFSGRASTYEGEVAQLKEVLGEKERAISELQVNLKSNDEVIAYQRKVEELEDQLAFVYALEEKEKEGSKQLKEEQLLRRSLEQNLAQMILQSEEYENQNVSLQERFLEEKNDLKADFEKELNKVLVYKSLLEQDLEQKSIELAALNESRNQLKDEILNLGQGFYVEKEGMAKQLEESQSTIAKLEATIITVQEELSNKSTELTALSDNYEQAQNQFGENKEGWLSEREDLTLQLEESQSAISQLEITVAKVEDELRNKASELLTLSRNYAQLHNQIESKDKESVTQKNELTYQLEEARSAAAEWEMKIATVQEELKNNSTEVITLRENYAQLQDQFAEEKNEWLSKREELTLQLEESQSTNVQLQTRMVAVQEELSDKSSEVEQSQSTIVQIEEQLELKNRQLDDQFQEIISLKQGVNSAASMIVNLEQEVQGWESRQNEINRLAQKYETESEQKKDALKTARDQIFELVTTKNQIQNEIQSLQEEKLSLEEKDTNDQDKDEEVGRLQKSLNTQRKALSRIEEAYSELLSRFEEQMSARPATTLDLIVKNSNESVVKRNHFTPFRQVHTVSEGESLRSISSKYYGNPDRWSELYVSNRDVIKDVDQIGVGTNLVIP